MEDNLDTILVTGGAGYIGSHTAKALRAAGYRVIIFDNLQSGHPEAALCSTLVQGDIHDTALVQTTIREYGVTAVMHFAARLSVAESIQDPISYYHDNVGGTLSILDAMKRESVRRFIFSSTAAVYGEPIESAITEDHPTRPINAYGETKLAVERALPHYDRAHEFRSIRLRYFNAAGADADAELGEAHDPEVHLIPRAIHAAIGGPRIEIFGEDYSTKDGTCLRDYVHVSDLADAHVLALRALEAGSKSCVYNLGSGCPYSVREVLAEVEGVTGLPVPWVGAPRRQGDPTILFASSERICNKLGWRPKYTELSTIIKTAWAWHRSHPNGFDDPVYKQ